MVTRRARGLFGLCLAIALLPLLSMAAGGREIRVQSAMAWVQLQAKSQASAQPVRSAHAPSDAHHQLTSFLPGSPFSVALDARTPARSIVTPRVFVGVGARTLHPARAPPALP